MTELPLTHCFTLGRSLGGAQSILQRHAQEDARWGLQSQFLYFFERGPTDSAATIHLGLRWHDTIAATRRRFQRAVAPRRSTLVYHNFWGLPFLSEFDQAFRRIGYVHTHTSEMETALPQQRGLVDAVICVGHPQTRLVTRFLPELPPDRICCLPLPIRPPNPGIHQAALAGRPLVIGYCGRLIKQLKRIDRLPRLIETWRTAGLDFRLEILGEGPHQGWLARRLSQHPQVIFHGRLTGDRYWQTLASWDVMVFVSDIEGMPLSLLEGLSCGVLPLFPRIGSGADDYVRSIRNDLLYCPEDFNQTAHILQTLPAEPITALHGLRQRCCNAVVRHLDQTYFTLFSQFVRTTADQPRISAHELPPRPFYWTDHCPFGLLRRIYPAGFWRPNRIPPAAA